jgi:hypothetical protein
MRVLLISTLLTISLYADFTISSGEILELSKDENITILEDLNVSKDAIFKAGTNCMINLESNWINRGDFISSTSSLNFIGDDESIIYGDNSFFNLFADKSIVFESGKTQKIDKSLSLKDGSISSTIFGTQSILDLSTTTNIDTKNLEIKDSKVIGLASAINPINSIDNGNNIMWFSIKVDCKNIGSDISWIEKFSCEQEGLKYKVDSGETTSEVIFDTTISDYIKETTNKSVGSLESTNIIYKDIESSIDSCSKDVKIVLYKDGTSLTGFQSDKSRGCSYDDPTLENWNDFKDSTKITIQKTTLKEKELHENSNSVIIVDVNLTKKLIIGGKYDTK